LTERQHSIVQALARCTFTPGSTVKRFVRWATEQPVEHEFSDRAAAFLERLAHQYRRQLGSCMAESCDVCAPSLAATARACPACGAMAGKPCRSKGKGWKARDPRLVHAARLHLEQQAKD
jgi:hypothetical protein